MPNQLAIVGSADVYSQAARKFLQLLPASCITAENMFLDSIRKPQPPSSPQAGDSVLNSSSPSLPDFTSSPHFSGNLLVRPTPTPNSATSPLTNLPILPLPTSTPSSHQPPSISLFNNPLPIHQSRSRSGSDASSSSLVSMSSVSSSAPHTGVASTSAKDATGTSNNHVLTVSCQASATVSPSPFQFKYVSAATAYFGYMLVSREAIRDCVIRCRCWSSVYDKCEISKEMLQLQEQNKRLTKSLEMEDLTSVRVHVTNEEENSSAGVGNDTEEPGVFRMRSTTLSSANVARRAGLRAHNKLHSRRAMVTKSQGMESDEGEMKLVAGMLACENSKMNHEDESEQNSFLLSGSGVLRNRRSGTVSGKRSRKPHESSRLSPKYGNNISLCQFEDKTGAFLKVVMDKLMSMMEQPPVVNVLMTQLLSRLAHYPQPLLRSLLLNHQLVLKPGVPNLLSVCIRYLFVVVVFFKFKFV